MHPDEHEAIEMIYITPRKMWLNNRAKELKRAISEAMGKGWTTAKVWEWWKELVEIETELSRMVGK